MSWRTLLFEQFSLVNRAQQCCSIVALSSVHICPCGWVEHLEQLHLAVIVK